MNTTIEGTGELMIFNLMGFQGKRTPVLLKATETPGKRGM